MTLPGDIARTEFRLVATYQVGDTLILVALHTACLCAYHNIFKMGRRAQLSYILGTCPWCRCCVIDSVALHCQMQGWEYTLLERELGAYRDSERRMLVTVIEFESTALMVGHLGLRMSLIAYPLVSLKSSFLDTVQQLLHSGQDVTGLLEEGMPSNTITDNQRTHFS